MNQSSFCQSVTTRELPQSDLFHCIIIAHPSQKDESTFFVSRPPIFPRALIGQSIRLHVPQMVCVPFYPLKVGLAPQRLPFLDFPQDPLDQILVLDRLARRGLPSVSPPVDVPAGHAVDAVFAVRDDCHIAVERHYFEGAEHCR